MSRVFAYCTDSLTTEADALAVESLHQDKGDAKLNRTVAQVLTYTLTKSCPSDRCFQRGQALFHYFVYARLGCLQLGVALLF